MHELFSNQIENMDMNSLSSMRPRGRWNTQPNRKYGHSVGGEWKA